MEDGRGIDAAAELHERGDGGEREGDGEHGSHQVAAPMAMRLGMANGAVAGKNETSFAQPLSGLPMTARMRQ